MQLRILVWIAGGLAAALVPLGAQTPPASKNDAQAQDLLRRAAAQQQTAPVKAPETTSASAVTNVPVGSVGYLTRTELDQQYLEGRLTAKQFQKALEAWLKDEPKRSAAEAEKQRKEAAQRQQQASKAPPAVATKAPPTRTAPSKNSAAAPAPAVNPPPANAAPAPPAEPTPQQAKISEVEARIDQMLRQKEAREKAALTNAATATNNIPVGPQTKRQRMDALLRQFIEGTLPEAEYNARRAKILAEPD